MSTDLPEEAFAAALAGFRSMTVPRLLSLLRHHPPRTAFRIAVGEDRAPSDSLTARVLRDDEVRSAWRRSADGEPERTWSRCLALGLDVTYLGAAGYPDLLVDDPLPPPVLFAAGDRSLLAGRRVGVVGTRNATAAGRAVARDLGRGLASAGVHVVSGLALGIDGAAHAGALDGGGHPIAVVATGTDVVYPRHHRELWRRVAEHGLLLTEMPPGTGPEAYRFPMRNRIIAALSEIVVVVESRERGGSLITASLAGERGIPVMAAPGSAANRAAAGTNALLRDGAAPVLHVDDVLVALELDHSRTGPVVAEQRPVPRGRDLAAYRACAQRPMTVGEVAEHTDSDLLTAAMSLARLEQSGWLVQADGWYETNGSPLR